MGVSVVEFMGTIISRVPPTNSYFLTLFVSLYGEFEHTKRIKSKSLQVFSPGSQFPCGEEKRRGEASLEE